MLNDINEFDIRPEYKIRGTTYWVTAPGTERPVARIQRDLTIRGSVGNLHQVYVGPGLDEWVGSVTKVAAYDSNRTKIGTVDGIASFQQAGMEVLNGDLAGLPGRILRIPGFTIINWHLQSTIGAILFFMAKFSYSFRGAHSSGFEIVKSAGMSNRYHFSIHDPRIDRLLVFTFLISTEDDQGFVNPKKFITEFASLFDPMNWKSRRKATATK